MMATDTMVIVKACGQAELDSGSPLAGPEWTMPAGRLTLLVAAFIGVCAAVGLLG